MRVLLVEDDQLHLGFLKNQVTNALPNVEALFCAYSGIEAETLARTEQLTSIVMDLRMKGRSGVDAARVIWRERPKTRILFWSNYSEDAYLRGISRIVPPSSSYGYVLKTASPDRLALALRAVLIEGQIVIDREVHSLNAMGRNQRDALTDTEITLLHDIALGLSDKLVAQRHNLSLRTIQNRLSVLYDKLSLSDEFSHSLGLEVNKRTRAIASAVKMGIVTAETLTTAESDAISSYRAQQ